MTRILLPSFLILCSLPAFAFAGASNSLMDLSPDGSRLLVANTDSGTVSVVDVKARKLLAEIPVGDTPEGVSWVGDSSLGVVTLWGADQLVFVDAAAGKVVDTLTMDDEPYGVVATQDGKRAFVSHDYPGRVSEIDLVARKVVRTLKVGEAVRGIALSADERTVYVTEFFTARLVAVDAVAGTVVGSWSGAETENLCRNVVVHPKWAKAYLPHIKSRVQGFDARGSIFTHLSVCDLDVKQDKEHQSRRTHSSDAFNGVIVVGNPWEVAVSPDGSKMYEIYAGTDDLNVFEPLDDSYRDAKGTGRPTPVHGKHPRAVRVSPDGKEVYIYNTLDCEVGVYDADARKKTAIKVCAPPHTAEWRRGKELFVSARQPMGSQKWISCSSCHPDGLGDGRVWQNPEGNRRSVHLFGLAHTHPLHWSADRDEVQDFEYTIRGKLMRGRGLYEGRLKPRTDFLLAAELEENLSGKSADLDALAVYTNSFQSRPSPHAAGLGRLTEEAQRGKALFFSEAVGCAKCHSGPYYTDSSLKRPFTLHDVGTGDDPREKMGPRFDTPTLIGVYRMGPYLHDGRAKTLRDVLTTCNVEDKHGTTAHLKAAEIDDLLAFLKSLPYEDLPEETPNTVKHRLRSKE